jgi:hypothetical protein
MIDISQCYAFNILCPSPNVKELFKSGRMSWVGHAASISEDEECILHL